MPLFTLFACLVLILDFWNISDEWFILFQNLKGPSQTEKMQWQFFSAGNLGNLWNHFKGASRVGLDSQIGVVYQCVPPCCLFGRSCQNPITDFFAAEFLAFSLCDEMRTGLAGSGWGWCQDFYCKRWFADFMRPQDYWMKRIIPLITSSNILVALKVWNLSNILVA